jgi:aminocarboxymuconate-semialdehyde decarboxylase
MYSEGAIRIIEEMDISDALRRKVFQDNAVALLGLKL